jgi:hypothetical protein
LTTSPEPYFAEHSDKNKTTSLLPNYQYKLSEENPECSACSEGELCKDFVRHIHDVVNGREL